MPSPNRASRAPCSLDPCKSRAVLDHSSALTTTVNPSYFTFCMCHDINHKAKLKLMIVGCFNFGL
jgi:hypothetical protein